ANLYHNGTQVTKDYTQALKWFLKGVENGFSESYVFFNIGKYYDEGLGVEQDVKESVLWYQKAADLGHKDAQYRLGRLLLEGNSVDCNEKKAFEYFEKAAAQNHDESTMQLGLCYFKGLGVKRDYQKAFAIFKDMRDNKDAKAILGYMYNFGLGIEKDYINAVFYYNQAKYDNEMAMVNLAHLKCLGYGTKQDQYDAKTLYEYAANKGNPIGLYYLGLFYENGIQTYVQYEKAKECYQKAAEKGHKKAKTALDNIIREHFSSQLLPEIPDSYLTDMMEP
ncbi:MAG TPA: hypothetical protein DDZ89_13910, partial [Clostridiales bacterium]|nr:hypothetical protein [Clostridiales bacterium]